MYSIHMGGPIAIGAPDEQQRWWILPSVGLEVVCRLRLLNQIHAELETIKKAVRSRKIGVIDLNREDCSGNQLAMLAMSGLPEYPVLSLKERRDWALRRGTPYWLWPEVAIDEWQLALEEIARVLCSVLANRQCGYLSGDPLAVSLAAYTSGTGPLLGAWLENGSLRADDLTQEMLRGHLDANRLRMDRLRLAATEVLEDLSKAQVPSIVLKGMDTAYSLFSEPALRPMADIDLLVPLEMKVKAIKIIGLPAGRSRWGETTLTPSDMPTEPLSLFRIEADDPWVIDLHHTLDFQVAIPSPIARLDAARPFESSRPHPVFAHGAVLSEPLRLLHLAIHAGTGLHSLTLLRQYELVLAIRGSEAAGGLDWADVLALAEQAEAVGLAYPALAMANKLSPDAVPPAVLAITKRECPARAVAVVEKLCPAMAHRVCRSSMREHFMWSSGVSGHLRKVASDLLPAPSLRESATVYRRRLMQVVHGLSWR